MIRAQFLFRSLSQMHEKNEWFTPPIKEANKIHFLTSKMFVHIKYSLSLSLSSNFLKKLSTSVKFYYLKKMVKKLIFYIQLFLALLYTIKMLKIYFFSKFESKYRN